MAGGITDRAHITAVDPAAVKFGFGELINRDHAMHIPELVDQWLTIIFTLDMVKILRQYHNNPVIEFWTKGIGHVDRHLIPHYLQGIVALHAIPTAIAMYIWYGKLVEVERFVDRVLEISTLVNFLRDNDYTGFYYEFAAYIALYLESPHATAFVVQLLTKPGFRADRIYQCSVAFGDHRSIQNGITTALGKAPTITVTSSECEVFRDAAGRSVRFETRTLRIKSWE